MIRTALLVGVVALCASAVAALSLRAHWIDGKLRSVAVAVPARRVMTDCTGRTGARPVVMTGDSRISQWPAERLAAPPVINAGQAGETALQLARRYGRDVLASCPATILIQSGVNDLVAASFMPEAEAREIVARVAATLIQMADDGAAQGARVFLTTIVPPAEPGLFRRLAWSGTLVSYVAQVNTRLRAYEPPDAVTLVDFAACLDPERSGVLPTRFRKDTLHLNRLGYDRLARLVPFMTSRL